MTNDRQVTTKVFIQFFAPTVYCMSEIIRMTHMCTTYSVLNRAAYALKIKDLGDSETNLQDELF